jgi:hypothetical protein
LLLDSRNYSLSQRTFDLLEQFGTQDDDERESVTNAKERCEPDLNRRGTDLQSVA